MTVKLEPGKFVDYWTVEQKKQEGLRIAYLMLCMNEDLEDGIPACTCGECWDCRFAEMHPELEGNNDR